VTWLCSRGFSIRRTICKRDWETAWKTKEATYEERRFVKFFEVWREQSKPHEPFSAAPQGCPSQNFSPFRSPLSKTFPVRNQGFAFQCSFPFLKIANEDFSLSLDQITLAVNRDAVVRSSLPLITPAYIRSSETIRILQFYLGFVSDWPPVERIK
jgi:hypothetical protein